MLRALKEWLQERPPEAVHPTYIALLAQARNPFFFTTLGVPDTIDGRFELVLLHVFLIEQRLQGEAEAQEFARCLAEAFFADMDRSLRELGVMDTGLKKRMKRMGKAYNGRLTAYDAALSDGKADREALKAALARNLYGTLKDGDVALLDAAAMYVETAVAALKAVPTDVILSGNYRWPQPAA